MQSTVLAAKGFRRWKWGRRHGRETDLHAQAIMTLQLAQPVWAAAQMLEGLLQPAVNSAERNARNADTALAPDKVRSWADTELAGLASGAECLEYTRRPAEQ